jgi:hypothetical protein
MLQSTKFNSLLHISCYTNGSVCCLEMCVTEGRDIVKLMRSVNSRGVSAAVIPTRMIDQTFSCSRNRPLLVSFYANRTIQQTLEEVLLLNDLYNCKHSYLVWLHVKIQLSEETVSRRAAKLRTNDLIIYILHL